ncbi:MAG: GTPase ObgE [Gemmatimonadetes bacterium]|nr:GTPase ObgE [Gemmatimonadota bacterium]
MFIDEVTLSVKSGAGGDGCMSFRREKFVPRGGPDGGDGGDGGHVIFRTDDRLSTLVDLRYRPKIEADRGGHGKGKKLTGARGENWVIRVPPGTVLRDDEGQVIADLLTTGEELVLLKGGRGGRGNARFATPQDQAPRRADRGRPGSDAVVHLELKLLADIGLVGFPNAGKSTLLSRLSAAHPKIADYPFTTLEPHLGIVRFGEYDSFVMADLPGLIEGAHEGKGLGIRFLKHIERTRILLFMLDATGEDQREQFEALRTELASFNPALLDKPLALAYTKADLLDAEQAQAFTNPLADLGLRHFLISSVSGYGLDVLIQALGTQVGVQRHQAPVVDVPDSDIPDIDQ